MNLSEARTKVRRRTRHVNDTVRLTDDTLTDILNEKYIELRTQLQNMAPGYGVTAGPELTVPEGDTISIGGLERVHRLEKLDEEDTWIPVTVADGVYPERHYWAEVSWERRGGCIVLHPEGLVSGTFRVLYYSTPSELTDDGHLFALPIAALDNVLIYRACAEVVGDDGDHTKAKYFEDKAAKLLEFLEAPLLKEYGVHAVETFQEYLGY